MKQLLLLSLVVVLVYSVSSPNPILVGNCNATDTMWGCANWNPDNPTDCPDDVLPRMWWAKRVVRTDDYRLTVGLSETSPVSKYTPGQFLDIHVRALKYGNPYRGILLYAEDANGNKVGDFDLSGEDAPPSFQKPWTTGICTGSLMHDGAREKPYYNVFKLRAPQAGTGPITIRCLLKYGYANTGAFFWPNSEGDVYLSEGPSVEEPAQWIKGAVGQSCNDVCTSTNKHCNEAELKSVQTPDSFESEIGINFACKGPLMSTCTGGPAYSQEGYCYYATDAASCLADNRTYTAPSCSAQFNNQFNGYRLCPCSGADRITGFFGLLMICLFWITGSKKSSSMTLLLVVLMTLSLVQYSTAHNWIRSRSRYFGASTKVPCNVGTEKPHVQVGPGQPFQVEWMTGHGSNTYFVLIKAGDESKLETLTDKILDTYIANAPANLATNPTYSKYHRRASNSTNVTVLENLKNSYYQLKNLVQPTDPNYVGRPLYLNAQGTTYLFEYLDKDVTTDAYVSYINANYSFIIAVWRYLHAVPQASEFDVTNFVIPAAQPAGRYVLWYSWRGYYDCIDIEKFDYQVDFIYGEYIPSNITWQRIDHCYFPKPRSVTSPCVQVYDNIDYCLKDCYDDTSSCTGVQVLPVHNPNSVPIQFRAENLIPWGVGDCYQYLNGVFGSEGKAQDLFANSPNTTYICYAILSRTATELISEYTVSDDPDDPAFFGTCYYKNEYIKMIGYPLDVNEAPIPNQWRFGKKCLTCENYQENLKKTNFNDVPIWKIADECRNCDVENGNPTVVPTPTSVRKDAICDGLTANGWGNGNNTKHTNCSDVTQECSLRLFPLNQRSYLSLSECMQLARSSSYCSNIVTLRVSPNNTQSNALHNIGLTSNYTECYCYLNRPCCIGCSSRRSVGWEIVDVAAPVPDPLCSTGIVAADGYGCCSATCGSNCTTTNVNTIINPGHCCASAACNVTRTCDSYSPPCILSTKKV